MCAVFLAFQQLAVVSYVVPCAAFFALGGSHNGFLTPLLLHVLLSKRQIANRCKDGTDNILSHIKQMHIAASMSE